MFNHEDELGIESFELHEALGLRTPGRDVDAQGVHELVGLDALCMDRLRLRQIRCGGPGATRRRRPQLPFRHLGLAQWVTGICLLACSSPPGI